MMNEKIKELTENIEKMNEALHIAELDAMIHATFPGVNFTMDYKSELNRTGSAAYFEAASNENLTDACGIFAAVLKECRIDTFNSFIKWDEEKGYQAWLGLHLSFGHFSGGSNGYAIADFIFDGTKWEKHNFKGEKFN